MPIMPQATTFHMFNSESMQFACCVLLERWREKLGFHPHIPKLRPSTHPITTLHAPLHNVMSVYPRFITLHESRKRKCHLGTLLLGPFTLFISWGKCCAFKSWGRWAEFHFSKAKLLSATRNHQQVWPAHLRYGNLTLDQRTLRHELVCMCVARWNTRGGGESNLSHRGAETGGKMRCRPRITPAVSMNEMTGLQGY